jgi:hypothetical protein
MLIVNVKELPCNHVEVYVVACSHVTNFPIRLFDTCFFMLYDMSIYSDISLHYHNNVWHESLQKFAFELA